MSAALAVYNCIELREHILSLLESKASLARMLSIHKKATAGVAARLYKEVHISMVSKMSRANARRKIYCDSVTTLDASPRPIFEPGVRWVALSAPAISLSRRGSRFDPAAFHRQLAAWKKKYPNLRTVKYLYPLNPLDDAYVAHLQGDTIVLHLESRAGINASQPPPAPPLELPPHPKHDSFEIHHTVSLRLTNHADRSTSTQWGDRIFRDPSLDKRVTYIDRTELATPSGDILGWPDQIIPFLERRKSANHPPLSGFRFPPQTRYHPECLRELVDLVGSAIRVLHLDECTLHSLGDPQSTLAMLETSFPHLDELYLHLPPLHGLHSVQLRGMRGLRKISVRTGEARFPHRAIAHLVCGLGSRECVYLAPELENSKEMKMFDGMVRVERSRLA